MVAPDDANLPGPTPQAPRRQKRSEHTRRSILAAAAQEFASRGYEGASVRAMARAVGQEAALIQYHFGDKPALWGAVLNHVMGRFEAEMDGVFARSADRAAAEVICNFVEALVRHAADNPVFVRLMFQTRLEGAPDTKVFQERVARGAQRIIALIRQAQEAGDFIEGEPTLLFYQMTGAALRLFGNEAELGEAMARRLADARFLDDQASLCIRLFMARARKGANGLWTVGDGTASGGAAIRSPAEEHPAVLARLPVRPAAFFFLTNLDAVLRRSLDERLAGLGLNSGQMLALIQVSNERQISSARLARVFEVSPQAVSTFVKALEAKGLIQRRDRVAGGRGRQIELTAAGAKVIEDLRRIVGAAEATLLEGLTFEEKSALRTLLERVLRRHRPEVLAGWSPLIDAV